MHVRSWVRASKPDDSLDYFPTPPWATRALIEKVLRPHLGTEPLRSAWEPACGEGHIAEVLTEYFDNVAATDIHAYGYGAGDEDFLKSKIGCPADWIVTNPPFGDMTEPFVLRALDLARVGIAMFVRLQWLESVGRYEAIFRDNPPTIIAFFAERVPLCKGRWDPEGSTATAYIWLVWAKGTEPRAPTLDSARLSRCADAS
ncbi:MAG: SAM-dependent methyltransferase [Pseudolabrys sp.]